MHKSKKRAAYTCLVMAVLFFDLLMQRSMVSSDTADNLDC